MGIREAAAAAKAAEEAAFKAEKKRIFQVNSQRGVETVRSLLGLEGKAVRAFNDEERQCGEGTTVELEEGVYVKVGLRPIYAASGWGGKQKIGAKPYLSLARKDGTLRTYAEFTTLGGLSTQLEETDAKDARTAEMKAQQAASKETAS